MHAASHPLCRQTGSEAERAYLPHPFCALAPLLQDIPPALAFEETLKLFLAVKCKTIALLRNMAYLPPVSPGGQPADRQGWIPPSSASSIWR